MSEDKRKMSEGILVSFEEGIMSSVEDRKNYQMRLDDFIARQGALLGKASEVPFCWKCNGTEVLYQKLELPLIAKNNRFKSVKLIAAACAECGEEYINEKEVRSIEEARKLINAYSSGENNVVELSVSHCDVCGGNSVKNTELEVFLISKDSKVISITIQEDCCMECSAVYFAYEGDQQALEHLKYLYMTR
ncbi:hypothetical protein G9G63_21095 [Paenibacillus sp. EKM202P]|uniref:hypothetical protein n=1 Tax=unclassified Paenibacillus TaxID=185978 RepID=UPI0013EB67BC|nr:MULTISPECIES: hypothetical protein [unclassified Paenibacillus]KAF6561247.1 hypothetical protein G9G63_21095 [Paenibacillus sp. EKM202P]KAF6566117.1 hypothetical protein G9G64_20025 [Paenibacillus sp. EKM207P]